MEFKLVSKSGEEINRGEKVKCFRGVEHTLVNVSRDGKVVVKTNNGFTWEYYPSVFNLKVEVKQ